MKNKLRNIAVCSLIYSNEWPNDRSEKRIMGGSKMELIKQAICVCDIAARGSMQAMADGDVIVPDVKPDILKLLQVDAEACVTDKYIENGRLVVCGRVDYKILYVPDKANERISSISASMEFRQTADSHGAENDAVPLASAAVDRVEFNAVNSRKLRLRAIVSVRFEVCRIKEPELCIDVDDERAERKKRSAVFESAADISEHDFSVKESIEVPAGQSSINEILKTDAHISDTEYKTVTGKAIVKGCVRICILYTDDEGDIKYIEAETPFTEVLDIDGAGEDAICDIDYSITGIMCTVEADSDGDMRIASVDVDICAAVRAFEETDIEILEDCYIPYMDTKCRYETVALSETVARPSSQNNLREIIDFPSNAPGVSGVYNVMTNASVSKAELRKGKLLCEGKIEAFILYITDSMESPIYSLKKDIKFSYMLECDADGEDLETEAKAEVRHVSYSLNAGGSLELRCLLEIDARITKMSHISNIVSVDVSDRTEKRGIIIYFVKNGDKLWDVAKRYGVTCESVMSINDMEDEKLRGGERLFIPPQ